MLTPLLLVAACSTPPPAPPPPPQPLTLAQMPAIDAAALLADTRTLASDEFGGRAPGSPGEEITVNYLVEQFKAAGAEPGNPDGTWVQKVPLVSLTATSISPLVVKKGGRTQTFRPHDRSLHR